MGFKRQDKPPISQIPQIYREGLWGLGLWEFTRGRNMPAAVTVLTSNLWNRCNRWFILFILVPG